MKNRLLPAMFLVLAPAVMLAQAPTSADAGGPATQTILRATSKHEATPTPETTTIQVNGKSVPLAGLAPVRPANTQIALLIDEGLSRSAGIELQDLRDFANSLPRETELFVGYMSNGRVMQVAAFNSEHAQAAKAIRLPGSLPGASASPYFCLSDFVKNWPAEGGRTDLTKPQPAGEPLKARFVLMLTNGVDPYNGSVSIMNQNSPYVEKAAMDAQRAGVAVYSIYYSDAAYHSGAASFSGQSYLSQIGEATGGQSFNQGSINPVSLKPYLSQFLDALHESYIATFPAGVEGGARGRLVQLKVSTSVKGLKLAHASSVMQGSLESTVRQ